MQKDARLFDDLARVAGGALSSFSALREEAEARMREQFERILAGMELVRRDEFDAVRDMAIRAREENTALAKRIADLEARTDASAKTPKAARTRSSKGTATKAEPARVRRSSRAKTSAPKRD